MNPTTDIDSEAAPLPPPIPKSAPVQETQRIQSLDVLRGVAVLGILYMNIQSFSMIESAYGTPTSYGDLTGANFAVWLTGALFFELKFITIFSILFGAGIVLMAERLEVVGRRAGRVHYRRMFILLLLGLAHAHILWSGDILYHYALSGMIIYPLRKRSARTLLILGIAALLIGSGLNYMVSIGTGGVDPSEYEDRLIDVPIYFIEQELEIVRGTWRGMVPLRSQDALGMELVYFPFFIFWRVAGVMFLGMALYKQRVLSAVRPMAYYVFWIVFGLSVGVSIVRYGVYRAFEEEWAYSYMIFIGREYNYWASLLVAMGIIGAVMIYCKRSALETFDGFKSERFSHVLFQTPLIERFAAVGQMALTNYLMHTIICTTIFYGHGFGLFGYVERTGQFWIVMAVWAAQLIYSPAWLRYCRFGPFEWLWRSLTYMRPQPLLRRAA